MSASSNNFDGSETRGSILFFRGVKHRGTFRILVRWVRSTKSVRLFFWSNAMPVVRKLVVCSAAAVAVGAVFASIAPTQANMYRITQYSTPYIQHVDCAVGFHLGPLGTCVIGADDPGPAVVERHDDNVGCETKSVTKQDAAGNSVTKTKTNC
jgi:hypothetical protein